LALAAKVKRLSATRRSDPRVGAYRQAFDEPKATIGEQRGRIIPLDLGITKPERFECELQLPDLVRSLSTFALPSTKSSSPAGPAQSLENRLMSNCTEYFLVFTGLPAPGPAPSLITSFPMFPWYWETKVQSGFGGLGGRWPVRPAGQPTVVL